MDDLTLGQLLREARAAAAAGERAEAAALYRQVVAARSDEKQAWFDLAALLDDPAEKKQALERVLALDPFHEEAKAALARLTGVAPTPPPAPVALSCANHPQRETLLRCNRCSKPICTECAVRTPVGFRCRECVRGQQDKFFTATATNQTLGYLAAAVCGVALGIAAYFLSGFLFFWSVFVAPVVGGFLSEIIWQAARRKRARNFGLIAAALCGGIGAAICLLTGNLFALLFVALAASAMYARLR